MRWAPGLSKTHLCSELAIGGRNSARSESNVIVNITVMVKNECIFNERVFGAAVSYFEEACSSHVYCEKHEYFCVSDYDRFGFYGYV